MGTTSVKRRAFTLSLHSVLAVALLWSALYLAWLSLAPVNFLYPLWYELLDIPEHIAEYGPQNRYKRDFEHTSDAERMALFAAIVDAVDAGGEGLESLSYRDSRGREQPLLRAPEREHLRSVARLIGTLRVFSYLTLGVLVASVAALRLARLPPPRPKRVLLSLLATVVAGSVAVLLIGAERVFYALHEWVFPAGEQWFFYWQDSLMTTLMKAPDLFGAIAATLLVVALLWLVALFYGVRALLTPGSR